jgi:fucose permease
MRKEAALAAAGYLCLFASGFSDNARGPLFPRIIETFRVSDSECSLLVVIGCLAGVPGSMIAGRWIASRGVRTTVRVTAALLALGLGLVALAGIVGWFRLVPIGAGVLGFGLGGLGVCANCCVTLATPVERRASALAGLHVTYALASLIAPLAIAWAADRAPWHAVLLGAALVPAALLPLSFRVPEERVERTRGAAPFAVVAPFALVVSLFVVAEVTVSMWLVLYATRSGEASGERLLALFFVGMGVARGLGSRMLLTTRVRAAIVLGALASAATVLLGLHVSAFFLALEGLTVGILFPATISALAAELAPEMHGPAIGVVSGIYSAALAGTHALVGWVSDGHGLKVALHVSPICAVAGVVVFLVHGSRRRNT